VNFGFSKSYIQVFAEVFIFQLVCHGQEIIIMLFFFLFSSFSNFPIKYLWLVIQESWWPGFWTLSRIQLYSWWFASFHHWPLIEQTNWLTTGMPVLNTLCRSRKSIQTTQDFSSWMNTMLVWLCLEIHDLSETVKRLNWVCNLKITNRAFWMDCFQNSYDICFSS
jgi:hypothetical protein